MNGYRLAKELLDPQQTVSLLEIVCAGTFGVPTKELVPGYPFQYQLLRFSGSRLTVETRRREQIHGAWKLHRHALSRPRPA